MKIYAIVCTRSEEYPPMLEKQLIYFRDAGIQTSVQVGQSSIFDGYSIGLDSILGVDDEDVLILLHDDVRIVSESSFLSEMAERCCRPEVGFVGPVGANSLLPGAMWGGVKHRQVGGCGGMYFRGTSLEQFSPVIFGNYGQVLIVDGMFMMIQVKKLRHIGIECPDYLPNGWHFYDLHYSLQAQELGYLNQTFPLFVLHGSDRTTFSGDWDRARESFSNHHQLNENGIGLSR